MAELVVFVDSFDHAGPAWAPAKYLHAAGTPPLYTEVPGPFHGVGARFEGQGQELGPAGRAAVWTVGAFSASLYLDSDGFGGDGEVPFLAPCYWEPEGEYPQHWLSCDAAGTVRVLSWLGPPFPPGGPPATVALATSAAGALPLDQWCRLEYRTRIGRSAFTGWGSAELRVDGVDVLTATGIDTTDETRAGVRAEHFRFGHLAPWPQSGGLDGVRVPPGAEGVAVAFDDVCCRMETNTTATAPMLDWHDDPASPHRVLALFPTGPGSAAELALVGAGANWAACADGGVAPPDGDTSYVEKVAVATSAELPVDLYAAAPAPGIDEGAARAWLCVWGLASSADASPRATVRLRRGGGAETATRGLIRAAAPTYRYVSVSHANTGDPTVLTNADLAGLEIGWGARNATDAPLAQTYRGTQVVAELWYRPAGAPPAEPGPTRWFVGWVP